MASIAIELNDAEIRVAGPEGVRGVEPGCALLDGATLRVGLDALRSARLLPAQTHDRFWSKLSQEPLPHPHPQAASVADLAFAQLSSLWSRFGGADTDVVFVVPGWFERPQLGLLLGIAEACGIRTRGLVDAAVASSREPHAGRALAYVDAGLHEAALTRLDQRSGVSAEATEAERGFGLAALHDDWLACIARAFLSQARFDPLHDAEAEQALFDRLPLCLDALLARESARVEIEIRGARHVAELRRADLADAARPHYARLLDLVERARPGSEPLVLQLSDRLARLPGLTDAIARARDVEPVALEPGAACAGALERIDSLEGREGVALVKRLAWGPGTAAAAAASPAAHAAAPTHVVVDGLAHALGRAPLSVRGGTLRLVGGGAVLEGIDEARRTGGERLAPGERLHAGDRVQFADAADGADAGDENVEIALVALASAGGKDDVP